MSRFCAVPMYCTAMNGLSGKVRYPIDIAGPSVYIDSLLWRDEFHSLQFKYIVARNLVNWWPSMNQSNIL